MKNELALKQRIAELEKLLAQKDAHIAALEARWRLAQQKQFGKSAEGFVGQGELFNEVEEIIEAATPVPPGAIARAANTEVR